MAQKKPPIQYPDLPIVAEKKRIVEAIKQNQVVIIAGDTGSGKTTQLPKMCLEAGRGVGKRIGCTQPRRIAAVSVATRVTQELGDLGSIVGYKIRFQDKTTRSTRIKFMTDGILLAETQRDLFLNGYDTIIIDEAHERSLNIDFLLGILKGLLARRKDLKVIITSATIDTEKFSKNFNNAPIVEVAGRMFPVEVRYQPIDPDKEDAGEVTYVDQAVEAVMDIRQNEYPGDILVFMPTERDIRETEDALSRALKHRNDKAHVLPLFGRMSVKEQARIFKPVKGGKIVVATNIAETSVTVPGIRYVVDTGQARVSIYNPRARTSKLPVLPISRASADQRKGRCGRIGPGVCVRLYSEENYNNRYEFTPPEIQRSNLADVVLRMIHLKLGDPVSFPFIDRPSARAIKDGYNLLHELGAVRQTGAKPSQVELTKKGRLMSRLPLDPRISRMIIEAKSLNALREVVIIAAALSIQDPRVRPADKEKEADAMHARFIEPNSDFLSFLKMWDAYHDVYEKLKSQSKVRKFCKSHFLAFQRMREWRDIYEQIADILAEESDFTMNALPASYDAVHQALLSGNLRTIGMKKSKNIYQAAQDKETMIFPGSGLFNKAGQWIMAAELVETTNLYARTVANIKPEWIEPAAKDLCRYSHSDPYWEKKSGKVVAFEKVTLFGLVIMPRRRVNFGRIKPDEARRIFIQSALVEGELNGNYGFLNHNMKLIGQHQEYEDRLRQRDIVADEYTLAQFYAERLPANVWDQATLNGFLKTQKDGSFLRMTDEDVLANEPEHDQLQDFPNQITVGNIAFTLTYKFEPGAEDDGVSLHIPFSLLPEVVPQVFDWLVPGMLEEKIVFLIKGLPKNIRKNLIPVADTANNLTGKLMIYQGSFYGELEAVILKEYRIRIERHQWPTDSLPDYLCTRFCLVDDGGKIIKASRNFSAITSPNLKKPKAAHLNDTQKIWERESITTWDFAGLPERVPVQDGAGNLTGFAYPAIEDMQDGTVAIRLCNQLYESKEKTCQGLLALYTIQLPKQFKAAKKDFAMPKNYWAIYEGFGSYEQVNNDLVAFILAEIFHISGGQIPTRARFTETITAVKNTGIYNQGKEIHDLVIEVLRDRRETFDLISRFEQMAGKSVSEAARFEGYRKQVAGIVPPDFLKEFSLATVRKIPRYLKALRIRVERAHASVAKDTAKARQIAPYTERLAQINEQFMDETKAALAENVLLAERKMILDEYREMIEEFKISLFAPEMKTLFPVSPKRLDKKWKEIEKLF
jgi:ATP-dependent helicase HrpA